MTGYGLPAAEEAPAPASNSTASKPAETSPTPSPAVPQASAQAVDQSGLPAVAEGWSVRRVLKSPALRHPSVVCTAPDGRIFVAEDPMDISTDRADAREGRILCIRRDGTVTPFAEGLHAVFGMKYIEGFLYVLHNPKFSVFRDDNGVGRDRVEIIESTLPEPWAKDWNDHIPANFVMGMDGFLYLAVGDKGLYGAVGRDGIRVDMHGGGVVRLRPDGTEIEVFARGLRNILDVGITEDDELFTYDNTDEKNWMSRLTHIIEGGEYGYPYDFHPRQPGILWCIADYGAGAATGVFADVSGVLAPPYRGTLFLGDFGKRQVTSVPIRRSGSTFEALPAKELFVDPPGDLRPVGICPTEDGNGILMCDWQHRDVKEKVVVGQLLELTFGPPPAADSPAAKPAWYVPAAMGQPYEATVTELLAGLSHPSRPVRLTAQRRLAERATESQTPLMDLIQDPTASPIARCHAIWALDSIDGGEAARAVIRNSVYAVDAPVRRQAVRQLGFRRVRAALEEIMGRLEDGDMTVRLQAAIALARLADPLAIRPLRDTMTGVGADEFLTYACFRALNQIGRMNPTAWQRLVAGLNTADPEVRGKMALALGNTYQPALATAVAELAGAPAVRPAARLLAIDLLAEMHRQPPPWKGDWWVYHPVNLPRPEKTTPWDGTPIVASALGVLAEDPAREIRISAWKAIASAKVVDAAPRLRAMASREKDPALQQSLLSCLTGLKDTNSAPLVLEVLRNPATTPDTAIAALRLAAVLGGVPETVNESLAKGISELLKGATVPEAVTLQALQTLGGLHHPDALAAIQSRLTAPELPVVTAAIRACVEYTNAAPALLPLLADARPEVQSAVVQTLGRMKAREAIPLLLPRLALEPQREEAFRALAAMPDIRSLDVFVTEITNRNSSLRELAHRALSAIRDEALPLLEARITPLPTATREALRSVYAGEGGHAKAKTSPLFAVAATGSGPEDYARFAEIQRGSAAEGRKHFMNAAGAGCIRCHKVGGEGADVGPDLTQVGSQFDRKALIESVLWPSRAVREGYQQTQIELKDGDMVSGLIKAESAESLTLRDAEGKNLILPKAQIESRRTSSLSMMPEGLHTSLSQPEFADLIAFLESLKKAP